MELQQLSEAQKAKFLSATGNSNTYKPMTAKIVRLRFEKAIKNINDLKSLIDKSMFDYKHPLGALAKELTGNQLKTLVAAKRDEQIIFEKLLPLVEELGILNHALKQKMRGILKT